MAAVWLRPPALTTVPPFGTAGTSQGSFSGGYLEVSETLSVDC
jgi:hypothetical protein